MFNFTLLQLFYSAFRCSVTWTPAGVGVGRVGVGVARLINFFSAVPHLQLRGFLKVSWCALVTSLTTLVDYYLMRLSRPRYSSKGSEAANRR